jgi:hypothetical protein
MLDGTRGDVDDPMLLAHARYDPATGCGNAQTAETWRRARLLVCLIWEPPAGTAGKS